MSRSTMIRVTIVAIALAAMSTGWAQLTPELGGSASMLARGNAGVALTNDHATGLMNPAALPELFRLPAAKTETVSLQTPKSGMLAGGEQKKEYPLLASASIFGDHPLAQAYPSYGPISAPSAPLFALDRAGLQVDIQSRFITVDQDFLEEVGVDWRGLDVFAAGFTTDTGSGNNSSQQDTDAFQMSWGSMGSDSAFGLGWINQFEDDLLYASYGRVLSNPRVATSTRVSAGVTVGHTRPFVGDSETTMDLALLASRDTEIISRPAVVSAGAVLRDATDEFGNFQDAGRRLDLGFSVVNEQVRLSLDLVDVTDSTAIPHHRQTGRRLNAGAEVKLMDNVVLIGGLRDSQESWGIEGRIPILSKIPMLRFAFGKSGHEERATLMIFLTPSIVEPN